MEPNIIDYYNDFPQNINIIDKLNEEYIDLQNKYTDIKNKYDNLRIEKPQIDFISDEQKDSFVKKIKKICTDWINLNEYHLIFPQHGFRLLKSFRHINLYDLIELELFNIFKNKLWCNKIVNDILESLILSFHGHTIPHWNLISSNLNKKKITDKLFHHIIHSINSKAFFIPISIESKYN